ncbi:hypothetical protein AQUCO_10200049v1 [Aquilegia coerulea]|uniref:Uncharacterized protein n=1 Tax=Aquilegia coerulea TaxID=218851 RepID=A0A2G5C402_AQUCA|nr:hypothetical protein AQUCO_10200049v1 [Aquilegia coerulea]
MEEENSMDSDPNIRKATSASMGQSPVKEQTKTSKKNEKQQNLKKGKGEEKSVNNIPFYKLFSFADSKDVLLMVIGTIAAVVNGMAMPTVALLIGDMINAFGQNAHNTNTLREVSKVSCWMITGERQAGRMRSLYLKTILRQDVTFFDIETNTGEVIGRMSGDTVLIQDAMGEKVGKFMQLFTTFIGGFVIAFMKGWFLTLLMLTSIPPIVISGALMTNAVSKMASRREAAYLQAGVIVEQTISSIKTASPCLSAFAAGQTAASKMFETIYRKPEIDSFDSNGRMLDDIHGDIELRDVCFSYPARPDEQIFNGFNLRIPSGTTSALVGQSGSGKSTVISLIERFYDPQAGRVLIDGINLKEFQLRWIRSKIGLVSQEPVLFASSIKDNITYGKDGATVEEIRVATELANAAKFIDKLPQGLDTLVGEHGAQLSGGQKQRICIARAILRDPRILLLDEATSALDAESEHIVQEALDRIMVNRTTVIVAHRLSTVKNADMIAVIHQGKIVEQGSHSELLKDPAGAYSLLICLQEVNRIDNDDDDKEDNVEFDKTSSQYHSFGSKSWGSPAVGRNGKHSFSGSFGLPTEHTHDIVSEDRESSLPAQQVPFRRLAYLNKPEILVLLLGVISAIVNGVVFPIFAILFSGIIKTFFEPKNELRKDSKYWAAMIVLLGLVSLVATPARTYFFSVAGCRLIQRIRAMSFKKVVYMEINWFDDPEHSSGSIGARLSADAATVRTLVGDALAHLVENTACAVAGLVIAFTANWALAFIILGLVPLIGINGYVQKKFLEGFSADGKVFFET